jgi:1,4-alpha-glucan branching enzyme
MRKTMKKNVNNEIVPVEKGKAKIASSIAGKRRVVFQFRAAAGCTIGLAGSFNNWDPAAKVLQNKKDDGLYTGILMLAPGTYEYKFCVDGHWQPDPENPNFMPNDLGTLNSVLIVE